jgi:hypothetical protein
MVAAILAWFLGVAMVMRRWPSEIIQPTPAAAPPPAEAAPAQAETKEP